MLAVAIGPWRLGDDGSKTCPGALLIVNWRVSLEYCLEKGTGKRKRNITHNLHQLVALAVHIELFCTVLE